jgi:GH25 family lysozyme M1 (1,4-beta-N-acetylmuramidase)
MQFIYRIVFVVACQLLGFVHVASAQTIHAVLVTDTLDGPIGAGISENRQNVRSFLENVQSVSDLKVTISEVTGADFNCKSIIGALDKLSTSPDDVVLFYYSGHGFREDGSQTEFPQFDCRRTMDPDTLGLSEAVKSIRTKPARLVIAIADTCNRKIEPFPYAAEAPQPGPPVVDRKAAFLHLFKDYRGTLTMSGSIPGEYSWYMTAGPLLGGFFTNQLLRAFNQNVNSHGSSVRWEAIAKDATKAIYVPASPPTTQNPQYATEHLTAGELAPASAAPAGAIQEPSFDDINPADLRRFWIGDIVPQAAAAPFVLTNEVQSRFSGTFGIDVSHYTFDTDNDKPVCETLQGYATAACSCTADWDAVSGAGVRYVYSKASDGADIDLSFPRVWKDLQPKHASNSLLRGAYHFLRPGVDADKQADAFLLAIGATNGQIPAQLSPVLDIEWSNKRIIPGTPEFLACPASRRTQNDTGKYYCDMWYVMTATRIAELAKKWIDRVEKATKLPVTIYTNPIAWWNAVMTENENYLLKRRPVWTSRYTSSGPQYDRAWGAQGGSALWKMAPLPRGASYPEGKYTIPHFWQFTEIGYLPSNFLTCGGKSARRSLDMNFIPVSGKEFPIPISVSSSANGG